MSLGVCKVRRSVCISFAELNLHSASVKLGQLAVFQQGFGIVLPLNDFQQHVDEFVMGC